MQSFPFVLLTQITLSSSFLDRDQIVSLLLALLRGEYLKMQTWTSVLPSQTRAPNSTPGQGVAHTYGVGGSASFSLPSCPSICLVRQDAWCLIENCFLKALQAHGYCIKSANGTVLGFNTMAYQRPGCFPVECLLILKSKNVSYKRVLMRRVWMLVRGTVDQVL